MRKRSTIVKGCALVMMLAILLVNLCGCSEAVLIWAFMPRPIYITTGFSEELVDSLEKGYGLVIPENAVFVEGYHDGTFLDPSVVIAFEIDLSAYPMVNASVISDILFPDGNWHYYGAYSEDYQADGVEEKYGISYKHVLCCDQVIYTYLYYTVTEDGYGYFCFRGHHPGTNLPGYTFG